jgi:glutamine synthetase adenylyltransferase
MNPSNREKYNKVIGEKERVTPVLFLLPMRTARGRFRKRSKADGGLTSLDFLERWLIMAAIHKNPKLVNNKQTHLLRNLHVTGIMNTRTGEATAASQALRKTLSWPL